MPEDNIDSYLARAKEFDVKAERAEHAELKLAYEELAKAFRALAANLRKDKH